MLLYLRKGFPLESERLGVIGIKAFTKELVFGIIHHEMMMILCETSLIRTV